MLNIHLGAHKTASTHLQASLRAVREPLQAAGTFYAGPMMLRSDLPLPTALSKGRRSPAARACRERLSALRARHAGLLISDENILGGTHRKVLFSPKGAVYPHAAARVRQMIEMAGGGPATLFLGLRDPAAFLVSAFALQVAHGNEIELAAYLGKRNPASVGWSGLVRRLAALAEVERIVVWRYEDYRAVLPRLLARLLPAEVAGQVPDCAPVNVSMTQAAYDWFLERAMQDTEADLRHLATEARERFARDRGYPPLDLVDEEVRAHSAALYVAELAALRREPKVEFLDP